MLQPRLGADKETNIKKKKKDIGAKNIYQREKLSQVEPWEICDTIPYDKKKKDGGGIKLASHLFQMKKQGFREVEKFDQNSTVRKWRRSHGWDEVKARPLLCTQLPVSMF